MFHYTMTHLLPFSNPYASMAYVFHAYCNSDRNYFDADGEGGRYDDMTTFAKMSAGGAGIHTMRYTTHYFEHTVQSAIRHV